MYHHLRYRRLRRYQPSSRPARRLHRRRPPHRRSRQHRLREQRLRLRPRSRPRPRRPRAARRPFQSPRRRLPPPAVRPLSEPSPARCARRSGALAFRARHKRARLRPRRRPSRNPLPRPHPGNKLHLRRPPQSPSARSRRALSPRRPLPQRLRRHLPRRRLHPPFRRWRRSARSTSCRQSAATTTMTTRRAS